MKKDNPQVLHYVASLLEVLEEDFLFENPFIEKTILTRKVYEALENKAVIDLTEVEIHQIINDTIKETRDETIFGLLEKDLLQSYLNEQGEFVFQTTQKGIDKLKENNI